MKNKHCNNFFNEPTMQLIMYPLPLEVIDSVNENDNTSRNHVICNHSLRD
jgi:hypothetical protein